MTIASFHSIVSRLLFTGAFGLLALALLEAFVNLFHYTILRGTYSKGRLMELSAVLVVFVIALLLRQIREEIKNRGGAG